MVLYKNTSTKILPWLFCCRVNLPSKKCHLWILGITPWLAPKSPINTGNPFGRKDNIKYQHCQYQLKVSNGCFCHPYSAEGFCISWGVTGHCQLWSFAQLFDLESHSASDLCFDKLLLFEARIEWGGEAQRRHIYWKLFSLTFAQFQFHLFTDIRILTTVHCSS